MNPQRNRLSNLSIVAAMAAVTLLVTMLGLHAVSLAYALPADTPALASQSAGPPVIATVPVGDPYGVGVNPMTNRVYVANLSNKNVSVIDGASNTVVATVPVGVSLYGVGVNPTTNRVYVSNYWGNAISIIDGANNTVVATVTVGGRPFGVGINPTTNRVYVANNISNTVSVIDGVSNTVVATVPVGTYPYDVSVNPTTNRIYVTNNSDTVSVIDGANNTVVASVPVGAWPMGVGVNPTTNRIYVANGNSSTVSVIDGASNTVVATVPVPVEDGLWGVGVNPTTNRVYVSSSISKNVWVINGANNTVVETVTVGTSPVFVGVNPTTNRVYVANNYSKNVSVIQDGAVGPQLLSLTKTGNGIGTVTSNPAGINCGTDCIEDYALNTTVTLTATPAGDSTFAGWIGCDSVSGNQCTVTMTANKTVTATFTQVPIIYVDQDALGPTHDGQTWQTAFLTVQDGLASAVSGDEIWVACGVYTPGLTVDSTFSLTSGVALYGGFATTTETLRAQRDWTANVTVLSGDIDGNDAADARGVVTATSGITGSNAYHVVTSIGVSRTASLDGFIVTAGQGGGMYNQASSPTLVNVTFSGNSAEEGGGGMFNESSSPTLNNVTFSGNSAEESGGGMFNESSSPTLNNVTFSGNSADRGGGGMFNRSSSPMLNNVTSSGNSATYGGGMVNDFSSSPTLSNSILWGDSPNEISNHGGSTAIITYSDVQSGWPGAGNINADPQFILPGANGNYHLSPCSPAIDAGNTAAVAINTDLDGNPRIVNGVVDMGAYESAPATTACLWVNLSVTPPATEPGRPVTYVLTFGNAATVNAVTATNVVITNITPAEITMPGVVAHSGALITATPGISFAWQVADLAPGDTGVITLSGVLSVALSQPVSVVSTATIASVTADGYPTDNVSVAVLRAPVVLYVNRNAPGPQHDGLSWTTAYTGVQTALAAAGNGNEIWVARGVYTPGLTMSSTFELKNGVALYGGFAATETLRAQRDWAANVTVLSGDVDGNDAADANGVVTNPGNIMGSNAYHVVMGIIVDETAMLDGFTVTAGRADDESDCPSGCGGGMFNYSGSPTLNNVSFSGNSAGYGGGMFNSHPGSPTLNNIILSGNSATIGGGIYNYSSSPTLNNVTLSGNSAVIGGGMINAYSSNPILNNVTFSGNSASYSDGGGGMLSAYSSSPTLNNSILWGDSPNEIVNWDTSTATITYSDVEGGYAGTGNLNANPLFVDAANGDLRLQAGSPAIDAGNNLSVTASVDLDGNPRKVDIAAVADTGVGPAPIVDMGAYEYQGSLRSLIHLAKTVSSSTAKRSDKLTYQLVLSATGATATASLTDTLPIGLTYVPNSATGGATHTNGQIRYTGLITPGRNMTITYQAKVNADVSAGSILINTAVVTGAGRLEESSATVAVPDAGFNKTLLLLYLGGDGNLADTMLDLLNAAETEAGNSNAVILAVIDGPGANDSYQYRLQHDHNPACPNYSNPTCYNITTNTSLYVLGQNLRPWPENTGSPYSLAEFLTSAELAYPNAAQILVRIAGHGDGWSPAIPGVQPSSHGTQPGGLLWDDHPGSSFNTQELSDAFAWAKQATGRAVDLLYLDACLMGAAPVADALRDSVNTLLVSESLEWTESTPIDRDIAAIDGSHSARQLGEHWLRNGADYLTPRDYPHTYSLIDESQMTGVRAAEGTLAAALSATLPASRDQISATWTLAGCFDSSGNNLIGPEDNLCDLSVWAGEIAAQFSANPTIVNTARALQTAVAAAVITETHHNGDFIYSGQTWAWGALGGLSEYLPLRADNWQRPYYPAGPWRDFLNAYWANTTPPQPPTCTTGNCPPSDPPAPAAIQAQAAAGLHNIAVSWSPVGPLPALNEYQLYRNGSLMTAMIQSQYIDNAPTLVPGADYCYQIKAVDNTQHVLGVSNIVCAQFGGLTLSIPHTFAPQGSTPLVPINVSQATGVCIGAMAATILYDPAIAVPTGQVSPTIYTAGYAFQTYTGTPGQIRIVSIGSCQPLYGGGSLFWVPFRVTGQVGAASPLDFIRGLTNTYLYDSSDLQTPVALTLRNGSLTVQSAYVRGDVNGDTMVNAADALLALQIASGQITPTSQQLSACDVNGDGFCTTADSTLILCYAATQDWNLCGVNVPIGLLRANAATGPVELSIRRVSGNQGRQVSVPLRIANGPEMAGGEFAFTYNRNLLTFDAATPTTGFIMATTTRPGLVRVALASHAPINMDSTLVTLRFTLNTAVRDESLTFGAVRLNDAAGRDFVTSALQKTLVFKIDPALTTIYLPLVRRN